MWNLVIWIMDKKPETIKEVETRYCCWWDSKLAKLAIKIGGVITPANMAKECCKPRMKPKKTGISEFNPKKG
ncbi:hypothetical protein WICPIJ_007118 [Wickerhamomyces pijperi]|uniref:Uncharacterized protein n=1 Tax=Wickerhamomyces pijperi TaxID=599730 RepID=A0A9P8Q155_WICPI|nr:hypothetical protein WICPIJ_007118 [Wickerhamomyces pijperi]